MYYLPALKAHAVSRHDDVLAVIKQPALFSSEGLAEVDNVFREIAAKSPEILRAGRERSLVNQDPPLHTRLRGLVNRAFTSARVADMESRIRELTRGLIAGMLARGTCDVIAELASPLPVTVIAEMLGVDPALREKFRHWSNISVGAGSMLLAGADPQSINAALAEFRAFLEQACEERRRNPKDDLISALITGGEGAQLLTADDVVAFTRLLLIAGNETTTNLLGNGLIALLEHPEEMARLRADPSLIPNAVEEMLRFDSPVQALFRRAVQDVEIAGTVIPAGDMVLTLLGSANRDPHTFADPDRFDVTRDVQGSIPFGYGIHFCLGAPLARLEARVALEELLEVTRDIAYAPGQSGDIDRFVSFFLRGPRSLHLQLR